MKKVCETVYWEMIDGSINSGKIVQITERPDCIRYEVENDEWLDTHILEDHNCLPEDDPRVQEYIRKQNESLWIARDVDGSVLCHTGKPAIKNGHWYSVYMMIIDPKWYPEITFENSPKKVKFELVEEDIIEKACKWLDDNLYTTCDVFNNTGVDSVDGYTVEKLIEEFKKAMKNPS